MAFHTTAGQGWIVFGLMGLLTASGRAGDAPIPLELEDPLCLGLNKQPYHATLMPYGTLKEALAANRQASSFCQSLNGPWKFNWVPRPEQRPVDFFKPTFDVSGWKDIPVPSNWEVQGYGTPFYRNSGYTIRKDFPHVMSEPPQNWTAYKERNPVGSYRRDFVLPADWSGRRVFLTFDGVDSAFFLWVNGNKIGYSVNSRNAAEFDVTAALRPGTNTVAAEVYQYSSGTWLEDQDMWRLHGIFRNVTLWSAPQVHMRDVSVVTDLDGQYKDATLMVSVKVKNYGPDAPARTLSAGLYDGDRPVAGAQATVALPELKSGGENAVMLKIPVVDPDKWTAETPRLYTTVLTLDATNAPSETLSVRTGFRKVEIKGRLFLVNGTPVKLKGVNRHEHWSDVGHAITEAQMIRDLEVIKQNNCNHVRTCHYSDDPRWYELCDEYGIWLVAEANLESHGYGYGAESLSNRKELEAAHVDRNTANVENFKNHPSVIIWSLGNEAGNGPNFLAALKAVKALDPTRPVHYERFGVGNGNPTDFDGRMYGTPSEFEGVANNKSLTKPFYICEYAHAMFNSMGSLAEYSEVFDRCPEIVGGAIWEYQDQALWNRRDPKHPILAFGGGFGEVPNDHYFIHKGVVAWDRSAKPHTPEMKRAYQWIKIEPVDLAAGLIKIRNKYQFISLEGFRADWSLSEDGREMDYGRLKLPAMAPGAEATVPVPVTVRRPKAGAEYFLRVSFTLASHERWARRGHEVAAAQFKISLSTPVVSVDPATLKPVTLVQDGKVISVTGTGFRVAFDQISGVMTRLERNGANLLQPNGGPKIHLWRAPHRNDDMWAYNGGNHNGLTALKSSVVRLTASQASPSVARVEAVVKAEGRNGFVVTNAAVYTVSGDGSVAVENTVGFAGPRIALARVGVRLLLAQRLDRFAYLGRGPMENYSDRKTGSDIGLYRSSVVEQQTPYEKPMECGNHEDVRWAALTGHGLPGLLIQSAGRPMQVSALPYTDEQLMPVEYKIDLPTSTATVLCLSARTLGVGSAGCGPRPLDKYLVWPDPVTFSYVLRLLPEGRTPSPAVAREAAPSRGD